MLKVLSLSHTNVASATRMLGKFVLVATKLYSPEPALSAVETMLRFPCLLYQVYCLPALCFCFAHTNLYLFQSRFCPGTPLSQLADKTLSAEAKSILLYKFGIIRQLISKSNVAVWNPDQGKMHFSLPREFSEGTNEVTCLTVTIPMTADRIADNTFTFNNTVWDEIESEVENGATPTGEMRDSKVATQWLLSFTRHAGHQILSMMSEADWEYTLDPAKSEDTAAALQSIQSNIVLGGAKKPVVEVAQAGAQAGADTQA